MGLSVLRDCLPPTSGPNLSIQVSVCGARACMECGPPLLVLGHPFSTVLRLFKCWPCEGSGLSRTYSALVALRFISTHKSQPEARDDSGCPFPSFHILVSPCLSPENISNLSAYPLRHLGAEFAWHSCRQVLQMNVHLFTPSFQSTLHFYAVI